MMREDEIIHTLCSRLTRSGRQCNLPFASDAEIVRTARGFTAFTIDGFSAEDCMPTGDSRLLGWNFVTATISDLLAVGATPEFMLNSMVLAPSTDEHWLAEFSGGMQEALSAAGAYMLGGDVGTGMAWHLTGAAIGGFAEGRQPVTRIAAEDEGAVMATGVFGDGNLAALGLCPGLRLESRLTASQLLPARAACMDTSDGLIRTLEMLSDLNPTFAIELDLRGVEYAGGVESAAASIGIRPEAFLLGSAGEYELVALIPADEIARLSASGHWRQIGSFRRGGHPGLCYRARESGRVVHHEKLPDPRAMENSVAYRDAVVALAARLFGGDAR